MSVFQTPGRPRDRIESSTPPGQAHGRHVRFGRGKRWRQQNCRGVGVSLTASVAAGRRVDDGGGGQDLDASYVARRSCTAGKRWTDNNSASASAIRVSFLGRSRTTRGSCIIHCNAEGIAIAATRLSESLEGEAEGESIPKMHSNPTHARTRKPHARLTFSADLFPGALALT